MEAQQNASITIAQPAPILLQSANFLFLGAALFSDVLLIRLFLSGAFICLIASTVQFAVTDGSIMLDALLWLTFTGCFHWRAAWALLREELPRRPLANPDDVALFCYLHRRTGMFRPDYDRLHAIGTWQKFAIGEKIADVQAARRRLHIIVDGRVDIKLRYEGSSDENANGLRLSVGSGECFDLRLLNMCGVFIGFPNEDFVATASADCLLFTIELDALERLVHSHAQLLAFLRTFALGQLARLAQRHPLVLDAFGQAEDTAWWSGGRSRDFEPLRPKELESMRLTLRSAAQWLLRSLSPSVQPGMRHVSNPLSGSLAQASVRTQNAVGLTDLLQGSEEAAPLVTTELEPM